MEPKENKITFFEEKATLCKSKIDISWKLLSQGEDKSKQFSKNSGFSVKLKILGKISVFPSETSVFYSEKFTLS